MYEYMFRVYLMALDNLSGAHSLSQQSLISYSSSLRAGAMGDFPPSSLAYLLVQLLLKSSLNSHVIKMS